MSCVFEHLGDCQGRLDPHHIVTQNCLKREFPHGAVWVLASPGYVEFAPVVRGETAVDRSLDDLLAESRNIVLVCRFHHERLENRRIYLDPPESAIEFAKELGLLGVLEKQAERRSAA